MLSAISPALRGNLTHSGVGQENNWMPNKALVKELGTQAFLQSLKNILATQAERTALNLFGVRDSL